MDGLGREFNVIPNASGVHVSLKDAAAVTYVVHEATTATTITLRESDNGSDEQLLTTVTRKHFSAGAGAVWTDGSLDEPTASGVIAKSTAAGQNVVAFTVHQSELSDGFNAVEVTTNGGTCVAIVHDLKTQRAPQNLPALDVT